MPFPPVLSGYLDAPGPIRKSSFSGVPPQFPGPIPFTCSVQYSAGSTSIVQLLVTVPAASSVQLDTMMRIPCITSGLQAHVSTSASQPVSFTQFLCPSDFSAVLTLSIVAPVCRALVSASDPRASSSTLGFRPWMLPWFVGLSASPDTPYTLVLPSPVCSQSSTQPFSQCSTLAPLTVGSTMVSPWSLTFTSSTPTSKDPSLPPQLDIVRREDSPFRWGVGILLSRLSILFCCTVLFVPVLSTLHLDLVSLVNDFLLISV